MLQLLPRRLVWAVLALGALVLLVLVFRSAPMPVDVGTVERGLLRVTIDAEGKTRVRQRSVISAPVAGRLARITLDEGDTVASGSIVARLDPLPLDAAVREARARLAELQAQRSGVETLRPKQQTLSHMQACIAAAKTARLEAEARVEKARAALAQAEREVQRAQRLETVGAISREQRETLELLDTTRRKEFEAAQLEVKRAASEVKAAEAELAVKQAEQRDPDYLLDVYSARIASIEAELAKLQDEAQRTDIRAPVGGQVLRVLEEHERVVTAGTPLLELGNLSDLELIIDVLSTDAVKIQPGATVLIEQWGGDAPLRGRVRLVEPSAFTKVSALGVEEQRVNVIADLIDNPGPLGDGYRIEARIVVWEAAQVLKVPVSALFRCAEAWCVFIVMQHRAEHHRIELGPRNAFHAEVRHGLNQGDHVILHPSERLSNGTRVRPR